MSDDPGRAEPERRSGLGEEAERTEEPMLLDDKRPRPLTHYALKVTGLTSAQFQEIQGTPVLLYSETPGWLEEGRFDLETIVIDPERDSSLIPSGEIKSHIASIHIIQIQKYDGPAPDNMIRIGRDAGNDIVFPDRAISGLHAYLAKADDGDSYGIMDAGSTNGTKVNDQKLVAHEIQPLINLDRIELGRVVKVVYLTPRGFYELLHELVRTGIL
jgi:hypothetical protein